jgi:hypothetical protein
MRSTVTCMRAPRTTMPCEPSIIHHCVPIMKLDGERTDDVLLQTTIECVWVAAVVVMGDDQSDELEHTLAEDTTRVAHCWKEAMPIRSSSTRIVFALGPLTLADRIALRII